LIDHVDILEETFPIEKKHLEEIISER